jgi:FkbM family methyltransferase
MNCTLQHKNLFKGKETPLEIPILDKEFRDQILEILAYEVYKPDKKKNKVIVDIGGNLGLASLYLSQFADKVYTAEPSPKIYEALVKNVKGRNIITQNIAIAALESQRFLYSDTLSLPQTFNPNEPLPGVKITQEAVNCIPINKFLKNHNIKHVDVLKIDVEGAEFEIFMSEAFEKVAPQIDMIVGEAHFVANGSGFPQAIPDILELYGFKTEFLKTPTHNYNQFVNYENPTTGFKRSVRTKFWTNFVARKIK